MKKENLNKQVFTYIAFSRGIYKIGRTTDLKSRFRTLKTANPDIEFQYIIKAPVENELKRLFKDKKYGGEWYRLDSQDLLLIEQDYI